MVHGTWADTSSWNGEITEAHNKGRTARAIAKPDHRPPLMWQRSSIRSLGRWYALSEVTFTHFHVFEQRLTSGNGNGCKST